MEMLQLNDLHKTFNPGTVNEKVALNGVSLQMEAGDLPDLIISDIRMPDMRGDEFLHAVKSDERFRHIRMVMLSGEDSTSERIQLLQDGAEDYIVKPFNPMELKVRIEKFLK